MLQLGGRYALRIARRQATNGPSGLVSEIECLT